MAIVTQTQDNNEQYSLESPEPSLPSPISTPPMKVSAYNSWETPHTTTDDNTFYSEDEPRRSTGHLPWAKRLNPKMNPGGSTFYHRVPHRRHHLHEGRKESWAWEYPFQKKGECRSTSAKPADKRSPQQRTSQVHREGSRTVKHSNLLKHLLYHSLINSYLRIRSRYVST